ncbi:MAG: hypothetical protein RSC76_03925 [Oscillospiraceae bacterium]
MKKLTALAFSLLLLFSLMGCASRAPFTPESFKTAAENAKLTVTEVDPTALRQENVRSITTGTTGEGGATAAQVIVFDTEAAAKTLYATITDSVASAGGKVEKRIDSSTYNKLFLQNGTSFVAVIRVENTLFYGEDAGTGEIKTLLEEMGKNHATPRHP